MSITDQRKEVVDFTDKYYATPAKFVAAKGAGFDISPEGLAGMAVGVQRATVSENFVRGAFPEVDVRAYATQDEANADLVSGRLDLVLADAVPLLEGFSRPTPGRTSSSSVPTTLIRSTSARASASRSARARTTCVLAFNEAIDKIRADGTYQAINEYFAFDVYGPTSSAPALR